MTHAYYCAERPCTCGFAEELRKREAAEHLPQRVAQLEEALTAMFAESGAAEGNPDSDSPAEKLARAALSQERAAA